MDTRTTEAHVAAILNRGYFVRHYWRGARTSIQRRQRAEAIRALGLACREAFNASDDFEALLTAVVDAVLPREPRF